MITGLLVREIAGALVSTINAGIFNILPAPPPSSTEIVHILAHELYAPSIRSGPNVIILEPLVAFTKSGANALHGPLYPMAHPTSDENVYVGLLLLVNPGTGVTSAIVATACTADIGLIIQMNAIVRIDAIVFLEKIWKFIYMYISSMR